MSFYYRELECKSRKSRNTWSNKQICPWSTEWSRAKAIRVLPREHSSHSKHPLPTTQGKNLHMDIARWPTPKSDWLYFFQPKMEKLYTVSKNKTRSWLYRASAAAQSLQACPTLCSPTDGSPPGSSVHGIFQAIVLEWIAIFFSRGSSQPRDWTRSPTL